MQTKEIAAAVKSTIEEKGWCQYEMENSSGKVCLLGALNFVKRSNAINIDQHTAFSQYLIDSFEENITTWNDHATRTEEEVLNVLDRISRGRHPFPLHVRIKKWIKSL